MLDTEYTFRRLDDSNRADLAYLYMDAFGENRPPVYTKMKFDTACFGVKDLAYFAYDADNKPAGFYALFPSFVIYNGNKILAGQVGDLMTHSNHRRKGLYLKLAHICHEQAAKEGVKLIFTIPYGENASYQGFINHLGFKKLYTMNEYIIKSPSVPLASMAEKMAILKPVYSIYSGMVLKTIRQIPAFSEQFIYRTGVNEVLKDQTFFQYKKYSPTHIVNLSGVEVWFKLKRSIIMVGDVRNLTKDNVGHMISGLKRICFLLGVRAVQFDVAPASPVDVVLSSVTQPVAHYYNALVKPLTSNAFENIYFTSGDLDNF